MSPMPTARDYSRAHEQRVQAEAYVRMIRAEARALRTRGVVNGLGHFKAAWSDDMTREAMDKLEKAAVGGAASTNFGAPLAADPSYSGSFLAVLRPATILGRLTGMRWSERKTWTPRGLSGAKAAWIAPGKVIPASKAQFDRIELDSGMLGALMIATDELIDSPGPNAEALFEADLRAAVVEASDRSFLDPTWAGTPDVAPPSITHAPGFSLPSSGTDAAAVAADAAAITGAMAGAGIPFQNPYWITSATAAAAMGGLRTTGGDAAFPGVGPKGGVLNGIPLLTSSVAGDQLVLLDASLLLGVDSGLDVAASKQASLELDDAPVADSATPVGAPSTINMFQTNSTAIICIRHLWFEAGRPEAVGVVTDFAPGAAP